MSRSEGLLLRPQGRSTWRVLGIVALGFALGALLTKLSVIFLPEGPFLEFFTTSVAATFGPLSVDLLVIALTVGPLTLNVNLFSIAGVLLVGYIARLWL